MLMPTLHDPVAISVGGLEIRWYALFILGGILSATWLVCRIFQARGYDPELALDAAPWIVFAAIFGARAYYVLLEIDRFARDPLGAFNVRSGGLTIHGAIVGGAIALVIYTRLHGQSFWNWADMIVPGLALGQALGRWGNWANQEAFGTPTSLPWAVHIDPARRPPGYETSETFHPTFLYESIWSLAFCAVLTWLVVRQPLGLRFGSGHVAGIYLIGYGAIRLVLESIRTDSLYIGPLPAAYWLSFALIAAGAAILLVTSRYHSGSNSRTQ